MVVKNRTPGVAVARNNSKEIVIAYKPLIQNRTAGEKWVCFATRRDQSARELSDRVSARVVRSPSTFPGGRRSRKGWRQSGVWIRSGGQPQHVADPAHR